MARKRVVGKKATAKAGRHYNVSYKDTKGVSHTDKVPASELVKHDNASAYKAAKKYVIGKGRLQSVGLRKENM